jgi:hypothetical protein
MAFYFVLLANGSDVKRFMLLQSKFDVTIKVVLSSNVDTYWIVPFKTMEEMELRMDN